MAADYCEVYWIHLPEHGDVFTEGYVGISANSVKRFRSHLQKAKRSPKHTIHKAIAKYKDLLLLDVLVIGSTEYCRGIENKLRPDPYMGWNINPGGQRTISGRKFSDEHRLKISNKLKGKIVTEETKDKIRAIGKSGRYDASLAKARESNRLRKPWQNPNSDIDIWLIAVDIYDEYYRKPSVGTKSLSKLFNIPHSKLTVMLELFRNGWIPHFDDSWLIFKQEKGN